MTVLSKLAMALQELTSEFSWVKLFWTGNIGLILPSLALLIVQRTFVGKGSGQSGGTGNAPPLRFWEFRKRIYYYYLFGALCTGWITWNAGWSYFAGEAVNERLLHICDTVFSPKVVTADAASTMLASEFFLIHLLHRLYVSTRVSIFSRSQALNLIDITLSLSFYAGAALSLYAESPDFAKIDGLSIYNYDWVHWYHVTGIAIFSYATIQHYKTHAILAKLRRNRAGHIVTTGYKMPKGGLFEYVSCPHYLCEILIYISLGMMLGNRSQTWWLLTSYVSSYQVFQALNTHMWYKHSFPDYPTGRKMLIPFVL